MRVRGSCLLACLAIFGTPTRAWAGPCGSLDATPSPLRIAESCEALGDYERAADLYERYAATDPGAQAEQALAKAIRFRLALADPDRALADLVRLHQRYPDRPSSGMLAIEVARNYQSAGNFRQTERTLRGAMQAIERVGDWRAQVSAHALLASASRKLGDAARAEREYARVVALRENAKKEPADPRGEEMSPEFEAAQDAMGEALFHFADKHYERFSRNRPPPFMGPHTQEAVRRYLLGPISQWISRQSQVLAEATAAYAKVANASPPLPARWSVAAGSRLGAMWFDFVMDIHSTPPRHVLAPYRGLSMGWWRVVEEDAIGPRREMAKSVLRWCLDFSVEHRYSDDFSVDCERKLAELERKGSLRVDEFRPLADRAQQSPFVVFQPVRPP